MTVEEWLDHHIAHLTGLAESTLSDYRAYTKNDINPVLGQSRWPRCRGTTSPSGCRP